MVLRALGHDLTQSQLFRLHQMGRLQARLMGQQAGTTAFNVVFVVPVKLMLCCDMTIYIALYSKSLRV